MRKTLFFIFLIISSIASAQSVVAVEHPGQGFQFVNNQTGSLVSDLFWDEAEPFVNGFSRVLKHDHFSFVNIDGKPVCSNQFEAARNFSHKLAAVKKETGWGFINETGKLIIPCEYEIVFDFKTAVTVVYKKQKWFLINTSGDVLKSLPITAFYGFNNGIARVEHEGRQGTMNTLGVISFQNSYHKDTEQARLPSVPLAPNTVTDCPDNIDFEFGSFLNWKCFTGRVDSVGNTNVITVTPSPPTANRHTLYNRVLPSRIDAFGLFPTNPPDGSNFAVKLGNTKIGAQAERIQYTIRVPLNDSNFSIKYDYAVVFEDPGHTNWTQPRFTARLFDSAANAYVQCASFEYISTSGLPGFTRSVVDTSVMFKSWSSVFVSLRGYAGKTMFLEFTTADCVRKGHWGYAYVDVEKPCGQSFQMQYECTSPNITTLTGPPGFQVYNWWNAAFSSVYASGQHVVLNPGPPVNTTIWLEMIPFNDFGCRDTIPVKITGVFNANFSVSDTVGICAPHTFTFYNNNVPSTSAIWDFGDGTTGTGDTVSHTYLLPGNYNVSLNVILPSGCIGTVIKTISVLQPVGSFYFNDVYFCNRQQVRFDAVVNNADSLFWDFGDGSQLATTQTTVYHTYALPGVYMPVLTVQSLLGCQNSIPAQDTIRIENLVAGFFDTQVKSCGSTLLTLTDNSYSYFGINSYSWNFGDGTTGAGNMVSHQYTVTGTYNIQLIITGISGCIDTIVKPVYIKVNNIPVATISGPVTQCGYAPVTFTGNYQSTDPVTVMQWTASNGTAGSGNTFTPGFTQPGTYNIQFITGTAFGCFDTAVHTIIINDIHDVIQPSNQELCNNTLTDAVVFTGTSGGTIYNWTNTDPSIGLAASGTGNIPAFNAINLTASPVTSTITVTPAGNGCPGDSKTFTITVNPTATVVQPADQVLCQQSTVTAIVFTSSVAGTTYSWVNNNPSIGLAASGTGNIAAFTGLNQTALPNTASITVTATANGCPGTPKSFSITVNPEPEVDQPVNQVLCNGAPVTAISFSGNMNNSVYSWTNNDPSIGLAASGTGNIPAFNAINLTASPVTSTITVTPAGNGCPGDSKTFTITVNPTATVVQPADQVLCQQSTVTAIVFTSSVAGTTYSWVNNNPSIGLAASGTGNIAAFTGLNQTALPNTAGITVTATANGCPGTPKSFNITVNPEPEVDQPADQVLCNGAPVTAVSFSGNMNNIVYSWTNSDPSIGLAASGTGNIPAFNSINLTASPVTSTITVTPAGNGCPGSSKSFTITVNPTATVAQPADQVLCKNAQTDEVIFTGSVAVTVYNWTNSNPMIGLPASGTGNIPAFTAINNTTLPVTATITVIPESSGCLGSPRVFTITVNPMPAVTIPADQRLCNGSTTGMIYFASAVNGAVYNWTNNNTSIGLAATGIGNIAPFIATNNSNIPDSAMITVIATAAGCSGPAKTVNIIVDPTAIVNQSVSQELCNGALTSLVEFNGNVTGSGFAWTNNNTTIGLPASGSGNILPFTAINNSDTAVIATISVTGTYNGCSGNANSFTITVNPTASINQPASQVVCNGAPTTGISFASLVNGTTFTWTNNNISIGLPAGGNDSIPSFNAMNATNAPVTAIISVTPTANGCPGPAKNFAFTVNPTPGLLQPGDQVLCNGASTNAIHFTGSVPGTIYKWVNNNPLIGLPANGTGDIPSFVAVNDSSSPVIATITVTPTASNCPGASATFTITIKASPQIADLTNQALCNRATTSPILLTGTINATTYSWTNNNPSIGLSTNGSGDINSFTAVNNTSSPVNAVISVSANAYGCTGKVKSVIITVHPTPAVNASADMIVCQGRSVQLSVTGAAQYSWSPAMGLSCSNCSSPVSTPSDTIRYIVSGTSAAGCIGQDSVLVQLIRPFRMLVDPGDTLCTGESTGLKAMQADRYIWSPSNGLNRTDIAAPTATPQATTRYRVVGYDAHHCFTDTGYVLINVGPKPTVNIGADINAATGTVFTFHPTTQNGPIVSYLWTPAAELSCSDCENPTTTAKNNIEYTLTVRNSYGCEARDVFRLNVFCSDGQVFVPNAFTPNGDGLNDILMVRGKGITVKLFRIFNRWGELVYEQKNFNPNDPRFGWDGKVRGVPATPDVFVYTAEVVCDNDVLFTYKGNTTILK